jgi:chemosensory pili system protein ChpE
MNLFLSSFILGIAFCAPPGMVTAETLRRGLVRGFRPALLVQIGSLIGDTTWATIALTGAAFLVQNWIVRLVLSLFGVGLLLRLAWNALRDAHGAPTVRLSTDGKALGLSPVSERGDFATGALLSLSNPFAIAFWLSVSASVFAGIPGGPQWFHFVIFVAAFLSSTVLWCFLMAGLVSWGRRFVTPGFFRWVNLVCGLALAYFGIQLAWQLTQDLL